MPVERRFPWLRWSAFLAKLIVRLWPDQTKQWGRAFEGELSEIADPLASFRWLAGGLTLLARELWNTFVEGLARPIGVAPGSPSEMHGKNWTRVPHTPRWITILLLLSSAAIVSLPEVRETFSSVWEDYSNPNLDPSGWRSVKKLRRDTETNRDPQLLAWLSLLSKDPAERVRLSEDAIEQDPSLTWVDYEQSRLPSDDLTQPEWLSMDRIERLQRWDSDNAIPHLVIAEVLSAPLRSQAFRAMMKDGTKSEWQVNAKRDSRWLAEMERAFSAPKYDNYVFKKFQLARVVSEKYGIRDPDPTLYILMQSKLAEFEMLRAYGDYLLSVGEQAERRGDLSTTTSAYRKIVRFSERMSAGQSLPIERLFATTVGMKAAAKLQPILNTAGRADEATLLGLQLAEWTARRDQQLGKTPSPKHYTWKSVGWDGLTIQILTFMITLLCAAFLVSQVVVWLSRQIPVEQRGRYYTLFCRVADIAPLSLIASLGALFFTCHPYAQAYKTYLSQQSLPDLESVILVGFVSRFVPPELLRYRVDPSLFFWTAVTLGLTLVAAFLTFRMLSKAMTAGSR